MLGAFFVLLLIGGITSEKRNHHQEPEWINHCWDHAPHNNMDPFCVPYIICPVVPTISNGHAVGPDTQHYVGDNVTYVCDVGYQLVGSDVIQCVKGEELQALWTQAPSCQLVCGEIPEIFMGTYVQPDNHLLGAVVTYSCGDGYQLEEGDNITCLPTGNWSEPTPNCIKVCGGIPDIANGTYVQPDNHLVGAVVTYSCEDGYQLETGDNITCLPTGNWSEPTPNCIEVCGPPPVVDNGYAIDAVNDSVVGTVVTYNCNSGYLFVTDSNTAVCMSPGIWSLAPICGNSHCPTAPEITNGYNINTPSTDIGSVAEYECLDGFGLSGTNATVCLPGGTWQLPLPECIQVLCPAVPTIENGELIDNASTTVGSNATYQCDDGFGFVAGKSTVCQPNGAWATPLPKCQGICPSPPTLQNGFALTTQSQYFYGDVVTYNCSHGYVFTESNDSATCEQDGTWTAVPICGSIECTFDPEDIVFILDGSGSLGLHGFKATIRFVMEMVDKLPVDTTQFGLMTYSDLPHKWFYLDELVGQTKEEIKAAINKTSYPTGNTYTYRAFQMAIDDFFQEANGMRPNATQVAIVVTDGKSANESLTIQKANELKDLGVKVYAVGVGQDVSEDELQGIASNESDILRVDSFTNITSLASELIAAECKKSPTYSVTKEFCNLTDAMSCDQNDEPAVCGSDHVIYKNMCEFATAQCSQPDLNLIDMNLCQPTSAPRCGNAPEIINGNIDTQTGNNVGDVVTYNCTSGYNFTSDYESVTCQNNGKWSDVPVCSKGCENKPADIVFILDGSGSVGMPGFRQMMSFVSSMVASYSPASTRFGLLTFSSSVYPEFYLNDYINNLTALTQAIYTTTYYSGETHTYEALNFTRSEMFTESKGMRPNVSHIAIVVTDGHSDNQNATLTEADLLRAEGVTIYGVGVGGASGGGIELENMASSSNYVFTVQDYSNIDKVAGPLQEAIACAEQNSGSAD